MLSSAKWAVLSVAISAGLGAVGCDSGSGDGTGGGGGGPATEVTFHKDVEPILQKNCLGCHREGKIGGFSLVQYEEAKPQAGMMAAQVEAGLMPPWGAQDTEDCHPRLPWKNCDCLISEIDQ